jgi:two-component system chemotaxis sensor kinase CheA
MDSPEMIIHDDSPARPEGGDLQRLAESFAALSDDTESAAKYLSIFIDEAEISLDQMTETLLALDAGKGDGSSLDETPGTVGHPAEHGCRVGPSRPRGPVSASDAAEQLLVDAHRIKGAAASIGLHHAAKLAHLMEDALQEAVIAREALSAAVCDALMACIDGLRDYVQSLRRGRSKTEDFPRLAQVLLEAGKGDRSPLPQRPDQPDTPRVAPVGARCCAPMGLLPFPGDREESWRNSVLAATPEDDRENTYLGKVIFQAGLPLAGLKGRLIYEKLTNVGEIRLFDPPVEQLEELESLDAVSFGITSEKSAGEIRKAARVAGIAEFTLEPLLEERLPENPASPSAAAGTTAELSASSPDDAPSAAPRDDPAAAPRATQPNAVADRTKPAETLRVEVRRLDGLMNLVAQLVIHKARFVQIAEEMKKAIEIRRGEEALGRLRSAVADLGESLDRFERVVDGLQQGVMQTRMLPIGPLFHRFQRVIRDMIRAGGKEIRLEIRGEKTELDKRMIDELGDPLIHLIRNAADHGIEPPQVREAAGKSRQGVITLNASHRGNRIVIQVSDDGQGLDAERIRARAVAGGFVAAHDAQHLAAEQCHALIWMPGLSTAETVTEVSGRGIGMDIVKAKIDELGGTVDLESTPGRGTIVTLKLPLTLAILPSLMVALGGEVFAIPLESVEEIIRLAPKDLSSVQQQHTLCLRGRVISVLRLDEVFELKVEGRRSKVEGRKQEKNFRSSTLDSRPSTDDPELTLVIVGEPHQELALGVDQVLGQQDIVIKSLAENYRNVPGIAGASILGDGRVSLILDVPALIERAKKGDRSPWCKVPGTNGYHAERGRLVGPFRQQGAVPLFSHKETVL